MSKSQLFIPNTIKVGSQNRDGTYTGKLAYVIYYDQVGKLRKEKSWETWRDKKIDPQTFENISTEGFVLNKGVGGQRQSYGWNARNEYIRVYDPRDFEFEISVANLLFILKECDCSKGKGLEGKFVYAWDGTELVLLPTISSDYQNSYKFTELQSQKVKVKELIIGATYLNKRQHDLTYLGRFDFYQPTGDTYSTRKSKGCSKKHIFWDGKTFVVLDSCSSIAAVKSDTVHPDYADLVQKYNKSEFGSKIVKLFTREKIKKEKKTSYHDDCWFNEESGSYIQYYTHYDFYNKNELQYIRSEYKLTLNNDGILHCERYDGMAHPPGKNPPAYGYHSSYRHTIRYIESTNLQLYAKLESGSIYEVHSGSLQKVKGAINADD